MTRRGVVHSVQPEKKGLSPSRPCHWEYLSRRIDAIGRGTIEAEPAGDAVTIAPRGHHFVGHVFRQEQHDSAIDRRHRQRSRLRVKHQFTAITLDPVFIEVAHQGNDPVGLALESVEMGPVEVARPVVRQVAFKGKQIIAIIQAIISQQPTPIREIVPEVPRELDRVVIRMIEKSEEARFDTMTEVARALRRCLATDSR